MGDQGDASGVLHGSLSEEESWGFVQFTLKGGFLLLLQRTDFGSQHPCWMAHNYL